MSNERDKALKIYYESGDLVGYLSTFSDKCSVVDAVVEKSKKIGEGSYGAIFVIEVEDGREYVVKKTWRRMKKELFKVHGGITLGEFAKKLGKDRIISARAIVGMNGGDPDRVFKSKEEYLFVPEYAKPCRLSEGLLNPRYDGVDFIPEGSYVCETETYSEFIIGVLCGSLYRNGISANFYDMFSFLTCQKEDIGIQYIFMEKMDYSLRKILDCVFPLGRPEFQREEFRECLLVQVLHAVAVYQEKLKLQHNDLHSANIFIKYLKRGEKTEFLGQDLFEADYFHYRIGDVDLYLPWVPFLVKIGDFGISVKYSEPIIGNKWSIFGGFYHNGELLIPNWYSPSYDSSYIVNLFHHGDANNLFIRSIFEWVIGGEKEEDVFPSSINNRPKPMLTGTVLAKATAWNILTNKTLMDRYLEKPGEGRIVTLGVI